MGLVVAVRFHDRAERIKYEHALLSWEEYLNHADQILSNKTSVKNVLLKISVNDPV